MRDLSSRSATRPRLPWLLPLVLLAAPLAVARDAGRPVTLAAPVLLESPAPEGSTAPDLAVSPEGEVWLSWLEPRPYGSCAFKLSRLAGRRFGPPLTIADGDSFMINWADAPGLLAAGRGRLVAQWRKLDRRGPEAYGVRLSQSADGGRSWSAPLTPHRDTTATEHGFVSLASEGDGVRVVWLDGRNTAAPAGGGEAHGHGGEGGDMTLRTARLERDGSLADEREIDPRVCDCCQTATIALPRGALTAYRDRDAGEIRDISVARLEPGAPAEPRSVHADGWRIHGCPVNGPALAGAGSHVAVAWYTAAGDTPRVLAALSADEGRSFGDPVRIDEGAPLGRVAVVALPDGGALVSWLEQRGRNVVLASRVITGPGTEGPRTGPVVTVAVLGSARSSGLPRVVRAGDRAFFAWSRGGGRPGVLVAVADLR